MFQYVSCEQCDIIRQLPPNLKCCNCERGMNRTCTNMSNHYCFLFKCNCGARYCYECASTFRLEEIKCNYCDYISFKCSYNKCWCGKKISFNNCKYNYKDGNVEKILHYPSDNHSKIDITPQYSIILFINYNECEICGERTTHDSMQHIERCCSYGKNYINICCREKCIKRSKEITRKYSLSCEYCEKKVCIDHDGEMRMIDGRYFCDNYCHKRKLKEETKIINHKKYINKMIQEYDGVLEEHLSNINIESDEDYERSSGDDDDYDIELV